jgi:hypothetical protein
MSQLEDKSVASIVTSPPYFSMRDYGNGENELGLEKDHEDYINNLINIFKECRRVLKDDGSLMVNINEKVENGSYRGVVHQFVGMMLNNGWDLNDEIIWLKNNPVYTGGNRTVRSHEYIFHFVKKGCTDFFYDVELAKKVSDPNGFCVYGKDNKPKFFSGMKPSSALKAILDTPNDLFSRFHAIAEVMTPYISDNVDFIITNNFEGVVGTSANGVFRLEENRVYINEKTIIGSKDGGTNTILHELLHSIQKENMVKYMSYDINKGVYTVNEDAPAHVVCINNVFQAFRNSLDPKV